MGHAMEVLTSRGGSWSASPGGMATTQSNFAQPSGGTVQSQQTPADVAGRYDPRMVKIVVEAPPEVASRLARIIESEGLQVSYSPPMETRSIESEVVKIVYSVSPNAKAGIEGGAAYALAAGAVKKILARYPKAKAKVEHGSDD